MTWWQRDIYDARRPFVHARAHIIQAIRSFFHDRGFIEVETPVLQVSPGIERHIRSFPVTVRSGLGQSQVARYLHSSPEFAMKKLLAAGETQIFQICHVFRDGEAGRLHQPEFTMLEWYRAGATYEHLMADVEELVRSSADAAGRTQLRHGNYVWDAAAPWHRATVSAALHELAGVDVLATVAGGSPDTGALKSAAAGAGVRTGERDTWDDIFHRLILDKVEPELARRGAAFLYDYPAPAGALARTSAADPRVCERVEAYVCGVELANGFSELTDADEQRRRFEVDRADYVALYGEAPPIDEDFLAALKDMPDAAGMALGIDRLAMLAVGAPDVAAVQWAPMDLNQA